MRITHKELKEILDRQGFETDVVPSRLPLDFFTEEEKEKKGILPVPYTLVGVMEQKSGTSTRVHELRIYHYNGKFVTLSLIKGQLPKGFKDAKNTPPV